MTVIGPALQDDGPSTSARRTTPSRILQLHPAALSRVLIMWLFGMMIALVPFLVTSMPPLSQQFFNIVRMYILAYPEAFGANFVIAWRPIPDLAMDLVVPSLSAFMSIETASWLFIIVTLLLLASGSLVLGRVVHGYWSILSLLTLLFLYNWILVRGYANNLFSLGLTFWALAAHVALNRSTALRIMVSSVSALAIYFCHLFPLGIFALVVTTWEVSCLIQGRTTLRRVAHRAAAAVVPFMLPMMLLVFSETSQHSRAIEFGFFQLLLKLELCLGVMTIGNRFADLTVLAGLCSIGAIAVSKRWLTCRPEWRLTVISLCCGTLLVPLSAFASYGVVERFSLSVSFLLPAILGLRLRDHKLQAFAAVTLMFLFFLRVGTVSEDWSSEKVTIQSYSTVFAVLKPNSVMLEFDQDQNFPAPLHRPERWSPPLDKIIALATLNGILVPKFYLKPGQQPVQYSPGNLALRNFQVEERQNVYASDSDLLAWTGELRRRFPELRSRFDAVYIAVFDPDHKFTVPLAGSHLVAALAKHRFYELDY